MRIKIDLFGESGGDKEEREPCAGASEGKKKRAHSFKLNPSLRFLPVAFQLHNAYPFVGARLYQYGAFTQDAKNVVEGLAFYRLPPVRDGGRWRGGAVGNGETLALFAETRKRAMGLAFLREGYGAAPNAKGGGMRDGVAELSCSSWMVRRLIDSPPAHDSCVRRT